MNARILIICNAFDDQTRLERRVTTDSPAGSRKVFLLADALRRAGMRPWVLSMGRGRAGGAAAWFPYRVKRVDGVPVVYAPFSTLPALSELVSLLALVPLLFRFRRYQANAALFYNRMAAYVPALLFSAVLRYRRYLDLEDGELLDTDTEKALRRRGWIARLYDSLCGSGALLACSALAKATAIRPTLCYYGTAVGDSTPKRFKRGPLTVLMGGALLEETGASLLAEAIVRLREQKSAWTQNLRFEVTGQGDCLELLSKLGQEPGFPLVRVHGRTSNEEYRRILSCSDIGLALKLNSGALAHTTFPSKVVEYAAAGLLVLTTDISDVRHVLGSDGALYLKHDDPEELTMLLESVVKDHEAGLALALNGMHRVRELCDPISAGRTVGAFLRGEA